MILGAGIDIVAINNFERICRDETTNFLERHFTPAERESAEKRAGSKVSHFAAWYAAKEAFIKALDSTHLFRPKRITNVDYREIEVAHDPEGRPYFILHGSFKEVAFELKATSHLSLSHDGDYAIAQVLLV